MAYHRPVPTRGFYKKRCHWPLKRQLAWRHWSRYNWSCSGRLYFDHPHQHALA